MSDILWSVDSLVVRHNAIFGYGWIFHKSSELAKIYLRLTLLGKGEPLNAHIALDAGKARDDVGRAFQNEPNALNSGFVILGAFSQQTKISAIDLICETINGKKIELSVPLSIIIDYAETNKLKRNSNVALEYFKLFKRGISLVSEGKIKSLIQKTVRRLDSTPKTEINTSEDLIKQISINKRNNVSIIIDHDLGGGANNFREKLVEKIVSSGGAVVIFTFHIATLSDLLIIRDGQLSRRSTIPSRTILMDFIKSISVNEVIFNNAVSFVRPEEIAYFIMGVKAHSHAKIKIFIHDFYLVCPSHFLIDYLGKYCAIPDESVCAKCLNKNNYGFNTLFVERNLPKWREIWIPVLNAADEIIVFSNNTAELFLRAYPLLDLNKLSIVPHKADNLKYVIPIVKNTSKLCIGIVGHIAYHKGSKFVKALADVIKIRGLDVKIVVIGSIDVMCDASIVSQTGKYEPAELPVFIQRTGVNIMLFPSIVPETFSYVVQELITMALPVVSFNLGAPAERIAVYPRGLVLDTMQPTTVLDELISFYKKIYF